MNNFEKLQSMSVEQFAEWLDENGMWDTSPWSKWFDSEYCQQCESIIGTICDDFGDDRKCEFAYCEVEHKCRFFQNMEDVPDCKDIIKMWLESEVEENEEII